MGLVAGLIMAVSACRDTLCAGCRPVVRPDWSSHHRLGVLIALWGIAHGAGWRRYIVWGALALAGTYSYYRTMLPLLVPFGVTVLSDLIYKRQQGVIRGISTGSLYILAASPLVIFFLPRQMIHAPAGGIHVTLGSWITRWEDWRRRPPAWLAFQFTGWPWTHIAEWMTVFVVASAMLFAVIGDPDHEGLPRRWLLWLAATWGIYYCIGRFELFPYGFRHSMILTPLLIAVVSAGIHQRAQRQMAALAWHDGVAMDPGALPAFPS